MKKLKVNAQSAQYDILIEKGILRRCAQYITPIVRGKRLMVISTSMTVFKLDVARRTFFRLKRSEI